ncbi:hypothetical protein TNCV_4579551 [Trichonephila clavipes]|nr:hypothetical protein TNCV_4579551 [Trichonephila clavipes]
MTARRGGILFSLAPTLRGPVRLVGDPTGTTAGIAPSVVRARKLPQRYKLGIPSGEYLYLYTIYKLKGMMSQSVQRKNTFLDILVAVFVKAFIKKNVQSAYHAYRNRLDRVEERMKAHTVEARCPPNYKQHADEHLSLFMRSLHPTP